MITTLRKITSITDYERTLLVESYEGEHNRYTVPLLTWNDHKERLKDHGLERGLYHEEWLAIVTSKEKGNTSVLQKNTLRHFSNEDIRGEWLHEAIQNVDGTRFIIYQLAPFLTYGALHDGLIPVFASTLFEAKEEIPINATTSPFRAEEVENLMPGMALYFGINSSSSGIQKPKVCLPPVFSYMVPMYRTLNTVGFAGDIKRQTMLSRGVKRY